MNVTWALCPVLTGKPVKVTDGDAAVGFAGPDESRLFKRSWWFFFFLNVPGGFYLSFFLLFFYTKVCFGFPSNVSVQFV